MYVKFLRKLHLEQNAKDAYVKTIVSDIDDAPMVTAGDSHEFQAKNEENKARLREAKARLSEIQACHNLPSTVLYCSFNIHIRLAAESLPASWLAVDRELQPSQRAAN